ncbi:MAG: DNA-directed RNA polymerase subunit H [Candidatus Rehaiarchaeum fermentans]|nr:DNA-directed RNA polymerase subunit H [Candidatus Rehaiarchaeum fermentans]MCW1297267.1 DNA-directed RNA polymerase subunit H [Candidatus Rehaiarchaeum fermentans]
MIDVLRHQLNPEARILPKEEVDELLNRLKCSKTDLPKIKLEDPVSVALKAKQGDVIEFTRKSETAGLSKYYRVVI